MQPINPETMYRTLIENMKEAVWVGDEHENTVYVNRQFCELFGYSYAEVLGKKSYELADESTADTIRRANRDDRTIGKTSSYEGMLLTKSGTPVPVLICGSPLEGGGSMAIILDLTEQKKKESLYKRLIENMNEAVWVGNRFCRTEYANENFCRLVEYECDELENRECYEFWSKGSVEDIRKLNEGERKDGMSITYKGNLLTKSGSLVPVILSGATLPNGGFMDIITDLRVLKRKEKREKILLQAIDHTPDAIITFDKNGVIQTWNKAAVRIFGHEKEDMHNSALATIFLTEDIEKMLSHKEGFLEIELKGRHKKNEWITISTSISPIFEDNSKEISAYLLIAKEVKN